MNSNLRCWNVTSKFIQYNLGLAKYNSYYLENTQIRVIRHPSLEMVLRPAISNVNVKNLVAVDKRNSSERKKRFLLLWSIIDGSTRCL